MKRFLSLLMSVVVLCVSLSAFSFSSYGATSYETQLKNAGFPDSYVSSLVTLHKKYPNWQFEPFKTGLKWSDAVAGERSYHSKQLIQKQSSLNIGYYCPCEKCYKNGAYVIQEGSSWVSASEPTVKYYLDPRNWLDEKNIFQFESTAYYDNQNITGIESIISSTWMKDAYITYKDAKGVTQTYKNEKGNKVKYSTAILDAAKNSKMSAYYLASKIVQEVGGAKNTAGGASGTYKGYEGIYNYYNIRANTGVADGLEWASVSSYETSKNCNLRSKPTTSSQSYIVVPSNTAVEVVSKTEKQADGYVWYNVNVTVSDKKYTGYIRSDLITPPTYNRPWTNPYLTIYNGATYIAKGYSTYQFTGYLQKFNVNKNSSNLYNHEYMANVQAASAEGRKTYTSYSSSGTLSSAKVFYIPVFDNMPTKASPAPTENMVTFPTTTKPSSTTTTKPSSTTNQKTYSDVTGIKLTDCTDVNLTYTWNKVDGASQYYLFITNVERGTHFSKVVTTNSATINNLTIANQYSVKIKAGDGKYWGEFSPEVTHKTLPEKASGLKISDVRATTATLNWTKKNNADGYIIYKRKNGNYIKYMVVKGGNVTTAKVTGLYGGNEYRFKIAAYVNDEMAGEQSGYVTAKTKPQQVTGLTLTPTKSTIKATWKKVSGLADGYQISFARDKAFNDKIATKKLTGQKNLTYTGKNFTKGKSYYVRVRAYKKIGTKTYYGTWSLVKKATCK